MPIKQFLGAVTAALFFLQNILFASIAEARFWGGRTSAVPFRIQKALSPHMTVTESAVNENPRAKTILLLQDIHLHSEAQTRIDRVLEAMAAELKTQGQPLIVGLEGAGAGVIPLDRFHALSHRPFVPQIAEGLMIKNILSGAERAGINASNIALIGVEDKNTYLENINALRAAMPLKKEILEKIEAWKASLDREKAEGWEKELRQFDVWQAAFQAGELTLPDYVQKLAALVSIPAGQLRELMESIELEKKLNFGTIESQRDRFIRSLVSRLQREQNQRLMNLSLLYKSNQISAATYFHELKNLSNAARVSLSTVPDFERYVDYVLKVENIRRGPLIDELDELEKSVRSRYCPNETQKELFDLTKLTMLSSKLAQYELTEKDWMRYVELKRNYPNTLQMKVFERFYELALERNEAMVSSMETASRFHSWSVLVAGGFHTQGLKRLLVEKGFSVVVATPKISKLKSGPSSIELLTDGRLPFDELFRGDRLFIPTPSQLADPVRNADIAHVIEAADEALQRMERPGPAEAEIQDIVAKLDWGDSDDDVAPEAVPIDANQDGKPEVFLTAKKNKSFINQLVKTFIQLFSRNSPPINPPLLDAAPEIEVANATVNMRKNKAHQNNKPGPPTEIELTNALVREEEERLKPIDPSTLQPWFDEAVEEEVIEPVFPLEDPMLRAYHHNEDRIVGSIVWGIMFRSFSPIIIHSIQDCLQWLLDRLTNDVSAALKEKLRVDIRDLRVLFLSSLKLSKKFDGLFFRTFTEKRLNFLKLFKDDPFLGFDHEKIQDLMRQVRTARGYYPLTKLFEEFSKLDLILKQMKPMDLDAYTHVHTEILAVMEQKQALLDMLRDIQNSRSFIASRLFRVVSPAFLSFPPFAEAMLALAGIYIHPEHSLTPAWNGRLGELTQRLLGPEKASQVSVTLQDYKVNDHHVGAEHLVFITGGKNRDGRQEHVIRATEQALDKIFSGAELHRQRVQRTTGKAMSSDDARSMVRDIFFLREIGRNVLEMSDSDLLEIGVAYEARLQDQKINVPYTSVDQIIHAIQVRKILRDKFPTATRLSYDTTLLLNLKGSGFVPTDTFIDKQDVTVIDQSASLTHVAKFVQEYKQSHSGQRVPLNLLTTKDQFLKRVEEGLKSQDRNVRVAARYLANLGRQGLLKTNVINHAVWERSKADIEKGIISADVLKPFVTTPDGATSPVKISVLTTRSLSFEGLDRLPNKILAELVWVVDVQADLPGKGVRNALLLLRQA